MGRLDSPTQSLQIILTIFKATLSGKKHKNSHKLRETEVAVEVSFPLDKQPQAIL